MPPSIPDEYNDETPPVVPENLIGDDEEPVPTVGGM
jgi:hypothetical protein